MSSNDEERKPDVVRDREARPSRRHEALDASQRLLAAIDPSLAEEFRVLVAHGIRFVRAWRGEAKR